MRYRSVAVPIFELEISARRLSAENEAARRLSGALQAPIESLLAPGDCELIEQLARRVIRSGLCVTLEHTLTWRAGEGSRQGLFEVSVSAERGAERVTLTLVDQSDWVAQRHSASHFTHFLRGLLDLTSTLFFVLDRDHQVVFANESFYRHLGLTQASAQEGAPLKLTAQRSELEGSFFEATRACLSEQRSVSAQVTWRDSIRSRKVFQMLFQPLKSEEQTAEQVLILGSDITELVSAHEEQEQLQMALNEAKRLDAIGQMAGTIAHDFNGFLTVIMGSVSLLELALQGQEERALLEGITAVCDQARQLTRELLSYSRSQVSPTERGSLQKLVAHLGFALPRLSKGHAKVSWTAEPVREAQIELSEAQCSQIIVNLVNNAIEATPPHKRGEVDVSCATQGELLIIEVSDHGDGIPEELLEDIFEPFFTTKKGNGGTGLGLASAQSLVKKAGGALTVRSTRGQGATFTVKIPILP